MTYLWVGLGGALGSIGRFWLGALIARHIDTFPLGTMIINIIGSFVISFFGTLTAPDGRLFAPADIRVFVMVGICGGFTTFSSFSLQTLALAQDGEWLYAGLNVLGSVVLCLVAVWLGHAAAAMINR